jgi:hypothetical protein
MADSQPAIDTVILPQNANSDGGLFLRPVPSANENIPQNGPDIFDDDATANFVKSLLYGSIKFSLFLGIIFTLLLICINFNLKYYAPLGIFSVVDLVLILSIIMNIRRDPQ